MVNELSRGEDLFMPLDGGPGPAGPISTAQAEAMARAVVRSVRRRPKAGLWANLGKLQLAASVLLALAVGGVAAAAVGYLVQRPDERAPTPQQVERAAAAVPQPSPKPRVQPSVEPEAPSRTEPDEAVASPAPQRPRPAVGFDADATLERANALRAAGRYRQAAKVYAEVSRRGQGNAAYVATVAVAGLRAEQLEQPRAALGLYRRALRLRPTGPLAHTARMGIADCYRALGDRKLERRALRAVLDAGPDRLLRARAERRLARIIHEGG